MRKKEFQDCKFSSHKSTIRPLRDFFFTSSMAKQLIGFLSLKGFLSLLWLRRRLRQFFARNPFSRILFSFDKILGFVDDVDRQTSPVRHATGGRFDEALPVCRITNRQVYKRTRYKALWSATEFISLELLKNTIVPNHELSNSLVCDFFLKKACLFYKFIFSEMFPCKTNSSLIKKTHPLQAYNHA